MTPEDYLRDRVERHETLLRKHFMGHYTGYDVATLINMTTRIANELRSRGCFATANRFDSYRDVLIYGGKTIAESLNDVHSLVYNGVPGGNCTIGGEFRKMWTKIFGRSGCSSCPK